MNLDVGTVSTDYSCLLNLVQMGSGRTLSSFCYQKKCEWRCSVLFFFFFVVLNRYTNITI